MGFFEKPKRVCHVLHNFRAEHRRKHLVSKWEVFALCLHVA